jgi:FkbM family methyltransferase
MKQTFTGMLLSHLRKAAGYQMPRLGRTGYRLFESLLPDNIYTELLPGIMAQMDMTDQVQKEIFYHGGRSEPYLKQVLTVLCSQPAVKTFLDIGSNYGFYSYVLASQFPKLSIHAFEPNPYNYKNILRIKSLNNIRALTPWNCGLASKCGELDFFIDNLNSGNCSFAASHPNRRKDSTQTFRKVPVRTFDEWRLSTGITFDPRSVVAKVDVEGFEAEVIQGMQKSLTEKLFRALVVEIFPDALRCAGSNAELIFENMNFHGYIPHTENGMQKINDAPDSGNINVVFLPE